MIAVSTPSSTSTAKPDRAALYAVLGVLSALLVVWTVVGGLGAVVLRESPPDPEREERARLASLKPSEDLDVDMVAQGKAVFMATCTACHGPEGRGMPGKGKNLVHGEFVWQQSDSELAAFIKVGRPISDSRNTTRMDMPPKGGNSDLTDAQLDQVVSFLRAMQKPARVSPLGLVAAEAKLHEAEARADAERKAARAARLAEKAAAKEAQQVIVAGGAAASAPAGMDLTAAVEDEYDSETLAYGGQLFASSCASCHGKDGKGLPKNGKDLVNSDFCRTQKIEALVAFVKRGRAPGEPGNTTGIAMPPKGGNPTLDDDKIEAIVAYVRSLQKADAPATGTN